MNEAHRAAAPGLPGSLLGMQTPRSHLRATESESGFSECPGGSSHTLNLRSTELGHSLFPRGAHRLKGMARNVRTKLEQDARPYTTLHRW